jgi:hypothetical protein
MREHEDEKHEFSHCKLSTCAFPIGGFSRAKVFSLVAFKQLVVLPLLVPQILFLTLVALNNWWFCHYWLPKFFFHIGGFKQLVVLPLLVAQFF